MPSLGELKVDAQPSSTSDRGQGMSSATCCDWMKQIDSADIYMTL